MPRGVYSIAGRRKVWTTDDEWVVADMLAAGGTIPQIAKRLKRSTNSVKVYCSRNVKVREIRPYSSRAVADLLGVACSKSVTKWIERGWLKGARSSVGAGVARRWIVTEDALMAFLSEPAHWQRWEPERITNRELREWAHETRSERFLTQAEVAKRYSVVRATVAAWLDRGQLPYVDTGSHRMVRESDLLTFTAPSERDRHGFKPRRFTAEEDARLIALRANGASWHECEYQLKRAFGSCAGRYERLMRREIATEEAAA